MADQFKPLAALGTPARAGSLWFRQVGENAFAETFILPGFDPAQVLANTPFDATKFGDVEFQFAAGAAITVTRSLDGENYVAWPVYDKNGNPADNAATPGIYAVDGGGWLKFSADVTVRAGA